MTTDDLRRELDRLFKQAAESLDTADVLGVLEEVAEPLRGEMCARKMDAEGEELKKRYKADAIVG